MRLMNKVEPTSRYPYEKSGAALRLVPGSTWGRVLEKYPIEKFTMIHGACTGVGVGGFLLGGGFNYGGSSRRLGSGSSHVLEYTFVDAYGDIIKVIRKCLKVLFSNKKHYCTQCSIDTFFYFVQPFITSYRHLRTM